LWKEVYGLLHNCKNTGVWETAWEYNEPKGALRTAEGFSPAFNIRMHIGHPPPILVLHVEVHEVWYQIKSGGKPSGLVVTGNPYLLPSPV
jgi:hypothetical protein